MDANTAATKIRSLTGDHSLITFSKAMEIVNTTHAEEIEKWQWAAKSQEIIVVTVPDKTAGTLALTNGSPSAVGSGTAFVAGDIGKYIRLNLELYVVLAVDVGLQTLTLGDLKGNTVNYAGVNDATAGYVMFERFYDLGAGVESIVLPSREWPIDEITVDRIDRVDSNRLSTSNTPTYFARGPRTATDHVQIEFWPRPAASIAIRIPVRLGHSRLSPTDILIVPGPVIIWQGTVEACMFLGAKTKDPAFQILGEKYRARYAEAYELAKAFDGEKAGLPTQVRDAEGWNMANTDFGISHDVGT